MIVFDVKNTGRNVVRVDATSANLEANGGSGLGSRGIQDSHVMLASYKSGSEDAVVMGNPEAREEFGHGMSFGDDPVVASLLMREGDMDDLRQIIPIAPIDIGPSQTMRFGFVFRLPPFRRARLSLGIEDRNTRVVNAFEAEVLTGKSRL